MEECCCVLWMKLQTITSQFGNGNEGNVVRRSLRLRYKVTAMNCLLTSSSTQLSTPTWPSNKLCYQLHGAWTFTRKNIYWSYKEVLLRNPKGHQSSQRTAAEFYHKSFQSISDHHLLFSKSLFNIFCLFVIVSEMLVISWELVTNLLFLCTVSPISSLS
jgi:hypothetical protein